MQDIKQWLNGNRDYETGRMLYDRHGSNAAYKSVFALGPSPYNSKKLERELEALVPIEAEPKPKPVAAIVEAKQEKDAFTDASTQVWEQMLPLLDEQRALHTELGVLATNSGRLKHAIRIMELADQLAPLWEQYHYAKEHGKLPEPIIVEKNIPETGAQLITRRATLRTYLSRYKNRPDKLEKYQAELTQIEEALKNVNSEV